jgi:circadian clock protein KaiB
MRSLKKTPKRQRKGSPIDSKAIFERTLKNAGTDDHYVLRLYITGTSVRSSQAIENIRSLCEEFLSTHYDLEVVDIYQQPSQAAKEQIIAAPTLIKELPTPPKRLIGNLSNRDKVLIGLNLSKKDPKAEPKHKTQWLKL